MPFILIKTSASEISSVISKETQEQAENALSVILNKSRDYVMSILSMTIELALLVIRQHLLHTLRLRMSVCFYLK